MTKQSLQVNRLLHYRFTLAGNDLIGKIYMKAVQINKYGGNEVIEINNNAPTPKVAPGFVLVGVYAAGVNPSDWKIRQGYFEKYLPLTFPATLGGDFSGVVKEVGAGVTSFKIGDEVYGRALDFDGSSGSFAEMVLVDAKLIALKPEALSHMEAAALPLVGVSAYQALIEHINLQSGQRILIHGGAGGIGGVAVQIAKHLGAYVIATSGSGDLNYVRSLGADQVIDYKTQDFTKLVNDVDAVFDTVGGEALTKSFSVVKKGGIIVSMVHPDVEPPADYHLRIIPQQTEVTGERLDKLTNLVDEAGVKVTIDKTFFLDEAAAALDYLKHGHHRGKVVLKVR